MQRVVSSVLACGMLAAIVPVKAGDWNQFRGPDGQGHAPGPLPTKWDATTNITWRKEIPGLGWSSPVIAAGKIYLTTAVPLKTGGPSLRALALDALTGAVLWNQEVFVEDANAPKPHKKNSHASPTPVVEAGMVYVHFGHMGTACLRAQDGTKVWATQDHSYAPMHGNGGSPILVGDRLIFSADGLDKQHIIALEKSTGKLAWKTPRKGITGLPFSFSTPLVITVNGQQQIISVGSSVVLALEPKTGREIWRVSFGKGYSVVPKPIYANGLVYICTGYTTPTLLAIRPDGQGDVTQTHVAFTVKKNVPLNPSLLAVGDAIYMVSDSGVLTCLDGKTGAERWSERIGGAFSASPIYAGGRVYLLDEAGTTTIFTPGDKFELVATNKLGERSLASFAVDGQALFVRTEKALYRIEAKSSPKK
ncbi:MAG: PQQ-binding-like beta-propeller repeat protein [Gemmataceae bacterium]|nr:PQQ-binding-like beta-propeller repeat protein [Gemmataceae bacterium]